MSNDNDPIVGEVREARRQIAEFYGNDLRRIFEASKNSFKDFFDSLASSPASVRTAWCLSH